MSRYRDVADRIALRDLAEQNEAVAIATRIANSRLAERIDPEEIRGSLADIPETIVVGPNAAPMRPIEPVRKHPVCKSRGRVTSAPPKQRAQAPS